MPRKSASQQRPRQPPRLPHTCLLSFAPCLPSQNALMAAGQAAGMLGKAPLSSTSFATQLVLCAAGFRPFNPPCVAGRAEGGGAGGWRIGGQRLLHPPHLPDTLVGFVLGNVQDPSCPLALQDALKAAGQAVGALGDSATVLSGAGGDDRVSAAARIAALRRLQAAQKGLPGAQKDSCFLQKASFLSPPSRLRHGQRGVANVVGDAAGACPRSLWSSPR